jgi:hypothetical protein
MGLETVVRGLEAALGVIAAHLRLDNRS